MNITTLKISAMACVLLGLSGCNQTTAHSNETDMPTAQAHNKTLAQIYDVSIKKETISFLTKSNGCTTAQNFLFDIKKEASTGASLVTVYLTKPDYCKAMPRLVRIDMNLGFQAMGQDVPNNIGVTNPVLPTPNMKKRK